VVIILYLFLYNLRTAFISAIAIPLSLISAVAENPGNVALAK
jgi:multidrug efflux pump subunit AcrB